MGLIFIFPAKGNYGRRKKSTEFITSTSLAHQANSVMSLTLDFWERILMSVTWSCTNMPSSFIGNFVPDQLPVLWTSPSNLFDGVLESS